MKEKLCVKPKSTTTGKSQHCRNHSSYNDVAGHVGAYKSFTKSKDWLTFALFLE